MPTRNIRTYGRRGKGLEHCRFCASIMDKKKLLDLTLTVHSCVFNEMIAFLNLPIDLSKNDKLPKSICTDCHKKCLESFNFILTVKKTQETLTVMYNDLAKTSQVAKNPESDLIMNKGNLNRKTSVISKGVERNIQESSYSFDGVSSGIQSHASEPQVHNPSIQSVEEQRHTDSSKSEAMLNNILTPSQTQMIYTNVQDIVPHSSEDDPSIVSLNASESDGHFIKYMEQPFAKLFEDEIINVKDFKMLFHAVNKNISAEIDTITNIDNQEVKPVIQNNIDSPRTETNLQFDKKNCDSISKNGQNNLDHQNYNQNINISAQTDTGMNPVEIAIKPVIRDNNFDDVQSEMSAHSRDANNMSQPNCIESPNTPPNIEQNKASTIEQNIGPVLLTTVIRSKEGTNNLNKIVMTRIVQEDNPADSVTDVEPDNITQTPRTEETSKEESSQLSSNQNTNLLDKATVIYSDIYFESEVTLEDYMKGNQELPEIDRDLLPSKFNVIYDRCVDINTESYINQLEIKSEIDNDSSIDLDPLETEIISEESDEDCNTSVQHFDEIPLPIDVTSVDGVQSVESQGHNSDFNVTDTLPTKVTSKNSTQSDNVIDDNISETLRSDANNITDPHPTSNRRNKNIVDKIVSNIRKRRKTVYNCTRTFNKINVNQNKPNDLISSNIDNNNPSVSKFSNKKVVKLKKVTNEVDLELLDYFLKKSKLKKATKESDKNNATLANKNANEQNLTNNKNIAQNNQFPKDNEVSDDNDNNSDTEDSKATPWRFNYKNIMDHTKTQASLLIKSKYYSNCSLLEYDSEKDQYQMELEAEKEIAMIDPDNEYLIEKSWQTYPWSCIHCEAMFDRVEDLRGHRQYVHKQCSWFWCWDCQYEVKQFDKFVLHVRFHRHYLRVFCQYCNRKFPDAQSCDAHVDDTHQALTMCAQCGQEYADETLLKEHHSRYNQRLVQSDVTKLSSRVEVVLKESDMTWKDYSWTCAKCHKVEPSLQSLAAHAARAHLCCVGARCADCRREHRDLRALVHHVLVHRPYLRQYCYYCDQRIPDPGALTAHIEQQHCHDHVCSKCGESFKTPELLNQHIQQYRYIPRHRPFERPQNKVFLCHYCGTVFKHDTRKFRRHLSRHGLTTKPCSICYKPLRHNISLRLHKMKHLNIKPYICDYCKDSFVSKPSLLRHMLSWHNNNKPYECNLCHKRFNDSFRFDKHVAAHNGKEIKRIKTYICDHCGQQFKNGCTLTLHLAKHDANAEKLICKICDKQFLLKSALKCHAQTHATEKPYTCDHCQKTFKTKQNIRAHIRSHMDVKPHRCLVCGKQFRYKCNLTVHVRVHTDDRPYQCELCDQRFRECPACDVHMRNKHGVSFFRTKLTERGRVAFDRRSGEVRPLAVDEDWLRDITRNRKTYSSGARGRSRGNPPPPSPQLQIL